MKNAFFSQLERAFLLTLISVSGAYGVTWKGSHAPSSWNKDVKIEGNVELPGGATSINAIDEDVTVYIDKKLTISGNHTAESQLYLRAEAGHVIRFELDRDLEFIGSKSGDPLLIVQYGPGTVEFAIQGEDEVKFTSKSEHGGVQYWVFMSGTETPNSTEYYEECHLGTPTLRFTRLLENENTFDKDLKIKIGSNSIMSYLAPCQDEFVDEFGTIEFDSSVLFAGRMILDIADTGAFIVEGHRAKELLAGNITSKNIDKSIFAGNPIMKVFSSQKSGETSAGLLIQNRNQTPFKLRIDQFYDLGAREDLQNYKGLFNGNRFGFVLGTNAELNIGSNAYVDYVGLGQNILPEVGEIPGFEGIDVDQIIKKRNPSAFVVDGSHDPVALPAKIEMEETSALFFRSGVASNGAINEIDSPNPFVVEPALREGGVGNIVFSVQGMLNINGPENGDCRSAKIEILSLEVTPDGGELFVGSGEDIFPLRSFARDLGGDLLAYNSSAMLVNNMLNLHHVSLVHTDENHQVFENNDSNSEPTYIGGETFLIKKEDSLPRPKIAFFNSCLHVHTDMAISGVDLAVPNLVDDMVCKKNLSEFVFYHNGFSVDNGTGRSLILGTRIGSTAADECSCINCDAHLDVIQLEDCFDDEFNPEDPDGTQTLRLITAANSDQIVEEIGDTSKRSIHSIYLGCDSNISIGTNDESDFEIETNPWLEIAGNFFSFNSRGGPLRDPSTSNVTGKGGIFVDYNGRFSIDSDFRTSINTMVTKSRNGIIDLPKSQVFFGDMIGIADWRLDLADVDSQVIIPSTLCISDYTLNWVATQKDFENFCPYELGDVTICACPTVTQMNVASLPTIQGTVDQLQIQATRIGDPAHIMVDGGHVRELVFLPGNYSAEAPVAVVVVKNDGRVGIGPLEQSHDSTFAATTLGVNGITIIADGEALIDLNQDMIVNNICSIMKGPNFTDGDMLQIRSTVPREIRIKTGGTLDLRSFDSETDLIEFCGDIRIILEPGSDIILGGGTVRFADEAQLLFEASPKVFETFDAIPIGDIDNTLDPLAIVDASLPHNQFASLTNYGDGLRNTDQFRCRIMGVGTLQFKDNSVATIPMETFVGIETLSENGCEITQTNITLLLQDSSEFEIGHLDINEGGALQIGNVEDFGEGHSVAFTLLIDGNNAEFAIGRLGFLGLGVGVVRADGTDLDGNIIPDAMLVETLNNVSSITFNFNDGRFLHDRIFSGSTANASLMAISADTNINYVLDYQEIGAAIDNISESRTSGFAVNGGGNIVLISTGSGAIAPIVGTIDTFLDENSVLQRLSTSILASTPLQDLDEDEFTLSGQQLFIELKTHDALLESARNNTGDIANAAEVGEAFREARTQIRVGGVANGSIVRQSISDILGAGSASEKRQRAIEIGSSTAIFNPVTGEIIRLVG